MAKKMDIRVKRTQLSSKGLRTTKQFGATQWRAQFTRLWTISFSAVFGRGSNPIRGSFTRRKDRLQRPGAFPVF